MHRIIGYRSVSCFCNNQWLILTIIVTLIVKPALPVEVIQLPYNRLSEPWNHPFEYLKPTCAMPKVARYGGCGLDKHVLIVEVWISDFLLYILDPSFNSLVWGSPQLILQFSCEYTSTYPHITGCLYIQWMAWVRGYYRALLEWLEERLDNSRINQYYSTYPIIVFDVDISSCIYNDFCSVLVAFSSCHV